MGITERMYEFDLSKCTRDQLFSVLRTAKDEIVKYTNYTEEIERIEECIKTRKQENKRSKYVCIGCIGLTILLLCITCIPFFYREKLFISLLISSMLFSTAYFFLRKNARKDLKKYEEEILDLRKKETEAMNGIKAAWIIPYNYRNKFAVTKMCEFVENKQANNWEEVTNLYEEYLHRERMQEIAQQQTELAQRILETTRRREPPGLHR